MLIEYVVCLSATPSHVQILELIEAADERVAKVKKIQAEVPTCSGCFVKEGLNKYAD